MSQIEKGSIRVFSVKNLPTRLSLLTLWTIVIWLLLDRLAVPDWVWGATSALWVVVWFVSLCAKYMEKQIKVKIED